MSSESGTTNTVKEEVGENHRSVFDITSNGILEPFFVSDTMSKDGEGCTCEVRSLAFSLSSRER